MDAQSGVELIVDEGCSVESYGDALGGDLQREEVDDFRLAVSR